MKKRKLPELILQLASSNDYGMKLGLKLADKNEHFYSDLYHSKESINYSK